MWYHKLCSLYIYEERNFMYLLKKILYFLLYILLYIFSLPFLLSMMYLFNSEKYNNALIIIIPLILNTLILNIPNILPFTKKINHFKLNIHKINWIANILYIWIIFLYYKDGLFIENNISENETFHLLNISTAILILSISVLLFIHYRNFKIREKKEREFNNFKLERIAKSKRKRKGH